ncbi:MAG: deoxyribonuclease [Neisseriaceae bacterium]|nr:MAG: deoxyribonuclease [Neisseriaceae bacterium]
MTRINVGINPKELPNKLLLAEHREITRIPNTIASGKAILGNYSNKFKLGEGHVKFFYDKVLYLFKRYSALYQECIHRGFEVTDKSSAFDKEKISEELWQDYKEQEQDRKILIERIESKGFKLIPNEIQQEKSKNG